jgi:asparagine synthase (glutamine-hydrolysing)
MVHLFSDAEIDAMAPDRFGPQLDLDDASPETFAELPEWPTDPNPVHAAMRWDLTHYLPFEVLRKVDRASMAVNLEVRCPLLDTAVADLACHLPPHVLMPGGRPKALLRDVAARYLPRPITRQRKRGFGLPIGEWFRPHLRAELRTHLLDDPALADLGFAREPVEQLEIEHHTAARDHTHRLFALLQLVLWRQWQRSGQERTVPAPPASCPPAS